MKVTRASKWGFECPNCNEVIAPDDEVVAMDGWSVEDVSEDGYTQTEPKVVKLYGYHEGCQGEDPPDVQDVWQCGKCETMYMDKDEAKECCK